MAPRPLKPPLDSISVTELDDVGNPSLKRFTYEDLKLFTDDFSDQNFIGRTQYCKVYRGRIPQGWINGMDEEKEEEEEIVTVKIWADLVDAGRYPEFPEDFCRVNLAGKFIQLKNEVALLSNPIVCNHPNLVKLMGWCCEIENENVGVVYDLNLIDTLRNLVPGEILNWADRIKIALGLASLLKLLHNHQPQYLVQNISAAHIMIDQDCNPFLLEFGMLISEVPPFPVIFFPFDAYGYWDLNVNSSALTEEADVFAFGVVLMEILCKCTTDGREDFKVEKFNFLSYYAYTLYDTYEKANGVVPSDALVEKSLMEDAGFNYDDGTLLSTLAVQCVQMRKQRPTMAEIVSILKGLHFVENWFKMLVA